MDGEAVLGVSVVFIVWCWYSQTIQPHVFLARLGEKGLCTLLGNNLIPRRWSCELIL